MNIFNNRKRNINSLIFYEMKFAKNVLQILKTVDNAPKYLMGGAPRNWRLKTIARDFDIYLPASKSNEYIFALENSLSVPGSPVDFRQGLKKNHGYGDFIDSTAIAFVNDDIGADSGYFNLNLVFYKDEYTPADILHKNFAFSICQAVMTDTGSFMYSAEFEKTMLTKVIKGLNGVDRDSHYAKKIESYYAPEYLIEY